MHGWRWMGWTSLRRMMALNFHRCFDCTVCKMHRFVTTSTLNVSVLVEISTFCIVLYYPYIQPTPDAEMKGDSIQDHDP
jgi:hypothetical protein